MADPIIPDDSISGNKVHGGVISEFQSTGIQDLATQTSLVVSNGTATVDRIRTKVIDGNVSVNGNMVLAGSIAISENVEFQRDLTIRGNIDANTITVRNLIADVKQETREPVTFIGLTDADANNKGLAWRAGSVNESLLYKNGAVASTVPVDAPSYRVNGVEVLSNTALAVSVANSNLRTVGRLNSLTVDGGVELNGDVVANKSLKVDGNINAGEITARVIRADQVITEGGSSLGVGNFSADNENQLDGQGLHFIHGQTDNMLAYRLGGRLWTTLNFDLQEGRSYSIDNTAVLSADTLGPTVTKSSLRQIGPLGTLRVTGTANISDFAFFSDTRLGLGTDNPNSALSILDNSIELVLGSASVGRAKIGTFTNDHLDIVTDDIARISISNSGEVTIGHPEYRNGVLRVNGRLYVDEVVAETRLLRSSSLQFETTDNDTFYGKGIEWVDKNKTRSLAFQGNPDRILSTESIELAPNKNFSIDGTVVLSKSILGSTVTESSLTKVGVLSELQVSGNALFENVTVHKLSLAGSSNAISATKNGLDFSDAVVLNRQGDTELTINSGTITIGNNQNTTRPVRIFGRLGVGVNTVSDNVSLAVAGNLSFANKQFTTGNIAPTEGTFRKGDICWNTEPGTSGYVGWICILEGTPGEWRPFGLIA